MGISFACPGYPSVGHGIGCNFHTQPVFPTRIRIKLPLCAKNPLRDFLKKLIGAAPVRKVTLIAVLCACSSAASLQAAQPIAKTAVEKPFVLKDANGKAISVPLVGDSARRRILTPVLQFDLGISPKLARAATIAQERANAHSKSRCWHYVKEALVAAGAVTSRPKTALAKQAGDELVRDYGFKKLAVSDPYAAPVGAVLVYTARRAAGHVEIRTNDGFVSDFRSKTPSRRPLLGVYAKT